MRVINESKNTVISERCGWADSFSARAKGLLGRKQIAKDEGLVITSCRSIHMLFMKFPISAIFIDKNNKVVKILDNVKVNTMSGYYLKADKVIELPVGKAKESNTEVGDIIRFEKK